MNEVDFSNFEKLLLELVFQNDQEFQNQRDTRELIERYGAKILHEKQHVLALKKDIALSDEIILDLQKYNRNCDSHVMYTSTSAALEREEEFLQIQLENAINTSENDKKTYQESIRKCLETLKQHEEKYMEFTFAKTYHAIKEEHDNILKVILKYNEQQKRKDKIILDILEPASFGSYIDWSLRLATLRKNTNETIHHISQTSHVTSKMIEKIEELEEKIKYIEHTRDICEKEHEIGRKERKENHTIEFQQANLNKEETRRNQSKEKKTHLLQLPDLPQKLMQSPRQKLSVHFSDTGTEKKGNDGDPQNSNSIVFNQNLCVEMDIQEPLINNGSKGFMSPTTNLQHQGQLRLGLTQKQIHSEQDVKETEPEVRRQQFTDAPDTSKDSGYVSQGNSVSYEDMECKDDGGTSQNELFALPRIPSPFTIPDPPPISANTSRKCERKKGKKSRNVTKSGIDLFFGTTEQTETSPCLNLFKTSTPKTPNFSCFESFATVRSPDQQEKFTAADVNPTSPAKDIGNFFQKMEGDNDFAFLFSTNSSQVSDDDRDDFDFTLPFGQNVKKSMEFEPAQSKTKFSFF